MVNKYFIFYILVIYMPSRVSNFFSGDGKFFSIGYTKMTLPEVATVNEYYDMIDVACRRNGILIFSICVSGYLGNITYL